MSDTVREVTHTSWFSRMASSFFGVVIGALLYVAMFPLLFWNEGRAVRTHLDLEEGKHTVVEAPSDKIDPEFEKKLVHIVGPAATTETLQDDLGASAVAIKLKRVVEMYQWEEHKSTSTKKNVGGGETTETTYTYSKTWSDQPINSGSFHSSLTHRNPGSFPIGSNTLVARQVSFGAFQLTDSLIQEIDNFEPLSLDDQTSLKPPPDFRKIGQLLYRGAHSESPDIGDVRVHYEVARPTTVSIVAQQTAATFAPYRLSSGREQQMLSVGSVTAEAMYEAAERWNMLVTWLVRAGGFLGMWFGLAMISAPLSVFLDVLPFLGTMARWGTGAISFVIATISAAITVAAAWLFYRPLVAVVVLVAAAVVVWLIKIRQTSRSQSNQSALFAPDMVPPPPPPPPLAN